MIFKNCNNTFHKFEARYDTRPGNYNGRIKGHGRAILAYIEANKNVTYVHDICVRCGKIINRKV